MFGIHKADDVIKVFVADEEAVVGDRTNLCSDTRFGFIEREVNNTFTCSHS